VSSTKEGAQATAEVTLQPDVNYHIACVYNGLNICVYVNHTLASVRTDSCSFVITSTPHFSSRAAKIGGQRPFQMNGQP
jgi:hypothetical protein